LSLVSSSSSSSFFSNLMAVAHVGNRRTTEELNSLVGRKPLHRFQHDLTVEQQCHEKDKQASKSSEQRARINIDKKNVD
jgi:hypothetical protein